MITKPKTIIILLLFATDDHNATFDKNFTITVTNVVEDLDGDGTEDYYDDDIDGDGLTNAEELLYNSDPWDASSGNRPPDDLNADSKPSLRTPAIGTIIGSLMPPIRTGWEISVFST